MSTLAFELLPGREAAEPPETRGLQRDEVRLMVVRRSSDAIVHTHFWALPNYLDPGDLIVINNSATLPAAVPATRSDGTTIEVRFATRAPSRTRAACSDPRSHRHIVELRSPRGISPLPNGCTGERSSSQHKRRSNS